MNRAALIVSMSFASYALAAEPSIDLHEGQWETTITMQMPGMPMAMPPVVSSSCITKKDLVPQTSQPGQECKVLKQKVTGSTVEWAVQCKDQSGATVDGSGTVTYKRDSFAGSMSMKMTGAGAAPMQMSYQMSGKRVGDCKK